MRLRRKHHAPAAINIAARPAKETPTPIPILADEFNPIVGVIIGVGIAVFITPVGNDVCRPDPEILESESIIDPVDVVEAELVTDVVLVVEGIAPMVVTTVGEPSNYLEH